ncbi:MAG: hypothetical protein ABIN44_02425 [Burkholderiaceae bacterium]
MRFDHLMVVQEPLRDDLLREVRKNLLHPRRIRAWSFGGLFLGIEQGLKRTELRF